MIGGVSFETSGDIVTKSAFASLIGVSAGRVSQFLSEKKIFGDALVGEGRCARIRVSVACQQLKRNLDISQRFGNGITTRLDQPLPVSEVGPPADPIEEQLKREKLEQLQRLNRKAAREEAEKVGKLTDSDLARQQMGRIAAQVVTIFEGSAAEVANTIAATFNLPPRDVVHLVRGEFRKVRASAAKALRRGVDGVPLIALVEVGEQAEAVLEDALAIE
jgi:hypothetical protein